MSRSGKNTQVQRAARCWFLACQPGDIDARCRLEATPETAIERHEPKLPSQVRAIVPPHHFLASFVLLAPIPAELLANLADPQTATCTHMATPLAKGRRSAVKESSQVVQPSVAVCRW